MEIANHPQCYLWSPGLQLTQSVTWSGACRAGLSDGRGTATWTTEIDEWILFEMGVMLSGHRRGQWVEVVVTGDDGEVTLSKGPYGADGERTGNWIRRWSDNEVGEGPFVDGEWQGRARPTPAAPTEPPPPAPDGPICTGDYSPNSCWMEITGKPGCYLWNGAPKDNETVTWTGECSGGLAQGIGRTVWYQNDEVIQTVGTRLRDGRNDGWTVVRDFGDDAGERERCYVNDEPRDRGIDRFSGNLSSGEYTYWTLSFTAGERIVANMESQEVDSYLVVARDDGTVIVNDDDGGSGTHARVDFQVPVTGQYQVRARGYDENAAGPFVLWVGDRDPGTTNPGEPCGPR